MFSDVETGKVFLLAWSRLDIRDAVQRLHLWAGDAVYASMR